MYIKNRSILYQFILKIAIVDPILIVEIRIDVNRRSNLKSEFDSTMMIRFAIPNRISLMDRKTYSFDL